MTHFEVLIITSLETKHSGNNPYLYHRFFDSTDNYFKILQCYFNVDFVIRKLHTHLSLSKLMASSVELTINEGSKEPSLGSGGTR